MTLAARQLLWFPPQRSNRAAFCPKTATPAQRNTRRDEAVLNPRVSTSEIPRAFVNRAQHLAGGSIGTAAWLQRAGRAVVHTGSITDQIVFRYAGPRCSERPPIVLEDLSRRAAVGVNWHGHR